MNAPRLGKLRKDGLLLAALQRELRNSVPPLTKAQWIFYYDIPIVFQIGIKKTRRRSKEDGGQAKFTENLRASPFDKDLSNETTFSLIHLTGKFL